MIKIVLLFFGLLLSITSCVEPSKNYEDAIMENATNFSSDLTCPHCGNTEILKLPSPSKGPLRSISCSHCDNEISATTHCVFCSYGSNKCLTKQSEKDQ